VLLECPSVSWCLTETFLRVTGVSVCFLVFDGDVLKCYLFVFTGRKQEIIKLTEQLLTAIAMSDFESYTYVINY